MFKVKKEDISIQKIQDFATKGSVKILVGYPSGLQHVSPDENGNLVELAELAKTLSFGTGRISPRPFIEEGIESQKEMIQSELKRQEEKVAQGQSGNFDKIGTMAVGAIQEFVRSDFYKSNVPNAPMTVENKGSDMPLINTAQMLNACTYIVEGKE